MDKDLSYIELFEVYSEVLTKHQKEIFSLYFECDLSLGEIAEIHSTTRQSVNDALRKSKDILIDMENKLGFCKIYHKINAILQDAVLEPSTKEMAKKILDVLEEV